MREPIDAFGSDRVGVPIHGLDQRASSAAAARIGRYEQIVEIDVRPDCPGRAVYDAMRDAVHVAVTLGDQSEHLRVRTSEAREGRLRDLRGQRGFVESQIS